MADNITIEIKDDVPTSIEKKIRGIGDASKSSYAEVNKLKSALKTIDVASVNRLQAALDKQNAASAQLAINNQRLQTEELKTAAASQKLAQAQTQAATAAARLATAQAQAAAAQDRATAAAQRLAAQQTRAQKALDAAGEERALGVRQRLEAVLNRGAAATDKATISQKQYNAAMRGVPAQITDIVVSLQGGQRPLTVLLQQGGQLKDMFGGIVPAIRALTAGLVAMITPVTVLAAAFAAFAAVVIMVESRMRDINRTVAQFKATGRDIDGTWIVQLRRELEQLPGVSRSAAGDIIKAFADVRNVGATNIQAASRLVADLSTALGTDVPTAAKKMAKALDDPLKGAEELDKELGFLTVQQFKQINSMQKAGDVAGAQKVLIDALKASYQGLNEEAMTPLQRATNDLGNAWNKFVGELQNNSAVQMATNALIGLVNILTRIIEKLDDLASWSPPDWVKTLGKAAMQAVSPATALFGALSDSGAKSSAIVGNANIRTRTGPQFQQSTDEKLKKAGIKKDDDMRAAESRAAALAKVNLQLENETQRLFLLSAEREKQQKFDAIEEQLTGKKIKLNEAEIASIKEKIAFIVDNARVVSEMQRIYEEVKGPQEQWNATITASAQLLEKGKITQEEYNRVMLKGEEAITNIKQPLREYMKDLSQQLQLAKMTSEQAAIESQIMQVRNDKLKDGIQLTDEQTDAIRRQLQAIQEAQRAQQAENAILDETINKRRAFTDQINALQKLLANGKITGGDAAQSTSNILSQMGIDTSNMEVGMNAVVDSFKNMYAQIDQLRAANLISEQDAANARLQIWAKQEASQLTGAQNFFGSLTQLQSSENKKLAAIGKAAAITNAVIDTYKSATGAYAAMSSIPYVGPALGAAAAAAAIAAGMANVQAIRSQSTTGFKSGGYTGDIPTTQSAGNVHGQEFVFDAPATARIGKENLEAMRQGRVQATGNAPAQTAQQQNGNSANVRVVNLLDPAMVGDFLGTPEGEQVMVNTIRKNADQLRQTFANA